MKPLHILLCLSTILFLAGCATKTYDIDVICNKQGSDLYICDPMQKDKCDDTTTIYSCYSPVFHIKCAKETVQVISSVYTCTTRDGQKVRIRVL